MTTTWRKSSKSGSHTNCVELGNTGAVRDSKSSSGATLAVDVTVLVRWVQGKR